MTSNFLMDSYSDFLPIDDQTSRKSLGEGNTPLIRSSNIGPEIGIPNLYFKLETVNPTGSFKDRGMFLAVAKAVQANSSSVICASTGNTSASASAYASLHGLKSFVVVPSGKIAMGKLAQATVHGASIIQIRGSFDNALNIVREISDQLQIALVNSVNPFRLEGQKTAAFEVVDSLGDAPDILCIPVGNAGNISAYWKGFKEYAAAGRASRTPSMYGFQAEGAAPIVNNMIVENPETIATAIRIGNPASWEKAINARDESGGTIDSVSDNEILHAYEYLASAEGIFCEPASASSVAGLMKISKSDADLRNTTVVCVITGHGLKDPDTALSVDVASYEVDANVEAVGEILAR